MSVVVIRTKVETEGGKKRSKRAATAGSRIRLSKIGDWLLRSGLCQNLLHQLAMHIRQPEIAALGNGRRVSGNGGRGRVEPST